MKNSKKGFTLVELLVVIAILAILATVAVVGYTSFIKKAELSNDQAAITQMNTGLQAAAIPNGFDNPSDAIDALYSLGWNLGKMQPYSNGFHYAYNHSENKMYLLDEDDNVVYPAEVDKSKLWGFYYNAVEGKLDGVTNYIAMTNITNALNFNAAFGDGSNYKIDLNGYYIDLGNEGSDKVYVDNGAYISGNVAKDEAVKTYTVGTLSAGTKEYSYKIFNSLVDSGLQGPYTFTNCIFYNASMQFNGDVTFENCQFIGKNDTDGAAVQFYLSSASTQTVTLNNCEFTEVARAINITCGTDGDLDIARTFNITNCVFNAVSASKHIIQIAHSNTKVNIENCEFTGLGQSPNIIRFHDTLPAKAGTNYASLADNVTWKNNTIADDIPVEKYVDTDGVSTEDAVALDNAMTNKMK